MSSDCSSLPVLIIVSSCVLYVCVCVCSRLLARCYVAKVAKVAKVAILALLAHGAAVATRPSLWGDVLCLSVLILPGFFFSESIRGITQTVDLWIQKVSPASAATMRRLVKYLKNPIFESRDAFFGLLFRFLGLGYIFFVFSFRVFLTHLVLVRALTKAPRHSPSLDSTFISVRSFAASPRLVFPPTLSSPRIRWSRNKTQLMPVEHLILSLAVLNLAAIAVKSPMLRRGGAVGNDTRGAQVCERIPEVPPPQVFQKRESEKKTLCGSTLAICQSLSWNATWVSSG